jgi:hypothetical protein
VGAVRRRLDRLRARSRRSRRDRALRDDPAWTDARPANGRPGAGGLLGHCRRAGAARARRGSGGLDARQTSQRVGRGTDPMPAGGLVHAAELRRRRAADRVAQAGDQPRLRPSGDVRRLSRVTSGQEALRHPSTPALARRRQGAAARRARPRGGACGHPAVAGRPQPAVARARPGDRAVARDRAVPPLHDRVRAAAHPARACPHLGVLGRRADARKLRQLRRRALVLLLPRRLRARRGAPCPREDRDRGEHPEQHRGGTQLLRLRARTRGVQVLVRRDRSGPGRGGRGASRPALPRHDRLRARREGVPGLRGRAPPAGRPPPERASRRQPARRARAMPAARRVYGLAASGAARRRPA